MARSIKESVAELQKTIRRKTGLPKPSEAEQEVFRAIVGAGIPGVSPGFTAGAGSGVGRIQKARARRRNR